MHDADKSYLFDVTNWNINANRSASVLESVKEQSTK